MPYPPELVDPMRQELTRLGFQELRTSEEVDLNLGREKGTTLLVVNSVCGCAAGNARPGVAMALRHRVVPDRLVTVFAGQDLDAVAKAREFLPGYPPSSPAIALLRDGRLLEILERKDIEGRTALDVAQDLRDRFDRHCAPSPSPSE